MTGSIVTCSSGSYEKPSVGEEYLEIPGHILVYVFKRDCWQSEEIISGFGEQNCNQLYNRVAP